jgi:hypothetical protein
MMRSMRLALVAIAALAACKSANPLFCDDSHPCSGNGMYCDLNATYQPVEHTCLDLRDASIPCGDAGNCPTGLPQCTANVCAGCFGNADCRDNAAAVCEQNGLCGPCAVDHDCDTHTGAPHCRNDGRCAECLSAGDCPTAAPACDAPTGLCRACRLDSECPSGACDDVSGQCESQSAVLYVDSTVATTGDCSFGHACKTIAEAIARVDAGHQHILLAPQLYLEGVTFTNLSATISGEGASIQPPSNTAAITVQGTSHVIVRDLLLHNGHGGGGNVGISCNGSVATTSLAARHVTINFNDGRGVQGVRCTMNVSQTYINNNLGGGIDLDGCEFDVSNSVVVSNGVHNSSALGGVRVNCSTGECTTARLSFLTIADNFVAAGTAGGVNCTGTTAGNIATANSVIVNDDSTTPVAVTCVAAYTDIDTVAVFPGTGNRNDPALFASPPSDYHLMSGSLCIDHADPSIMTGSDYDGHARVQGGRADMGAFEAR